MRTRNARKAAADSLAENDLKETSTDDKKSRKQNKTEEQNTKEGGADSQSA